MKKNSQFLTLSVFNCIIEVNVSSTELSEILVLVYGAMLVPTSKQVADLTYTISRNDADNEICVSRESGPQYFTKEIGEFIFFFEKDMTIELQKIRSDLVFIHSAALEYQGQGLLLVAPSGTGKSTTSWAMLNSGFNYLSDELAPIDMNTMHVEPYPHALCLKAIPPLFELPDDSLHTRCTIHVPVKSENSGRFESVKLQHIFYLEYDSEIKEPEIHSISTAEASAKLFINSLNILAHDKGDSGMQAAISIVRGVNSYVLKSNHLDKTCEQVKRLLNKNS